MVWVKICGLSSPAAIEASVAAGADALGLVFAPSRRQVSRATAESLCRNLPAKVKKVGVFVNAPAKLVEEIYHACSLDLVQLHGDESPAYCQALNLPVLKALHLRSHAELSLLANYQVEAILLDSSRPGSGQSFDWSLAQAACQRHRRIILAGGLNPSNIAGALAQVRPYGVDVSSGVETDGKKDLEKIARFIALAKDFSHPREP